MTDRRLNLPVGDVRRLLRDDMTALRRVPTPTLRRIAPGDRLWIAEGFYLPVLYNGWPPSQVADRFPDTQIWYVADGEPSVHAGSSRPAHTMPRRISRLWLAVESVEKRALQDLTTDDIRALGFASRDDFRVDWNKNRRAARAFYAERDEDTATWNHNPDVLDLRFTLHRESIECALAREIKAEAG